MDYFCFEQINSLKEPLAITFDDENFAYQIGRNLLKYRKIADINQQVMAEAFGVSIAQYRKYEKGEDCPKMHSVARWSIITGSPNTLLLSDTDYAQYVSIPEKVWELVPFLCALSHSSDLVFNSLFSLSREIVDVASEQEVFFGDVPDLSNILIDIESNYYVKVAKNMKLIRDCLELSQDSLSELLGISLSAYQQYEKQINSPRISFSFFARSHSILQLNSRWATTGKTEFSKFNLRRNHRISLMLPIINSSSRHQKVSIQEIFKSVSQSLINEQLDSEISKYESLKSN
ncbi:hypothetical protein CS022_14845 [Veronia nyctiphanis]|uniref:HTH cro/C1-type domain-containing protein n=1 Tax=Veronia nyctiphanis TaxID=1278244 RepID=A0A4Q0YPV9_9GAMM|nr:helix-turn-helix transcriptional regulator [Veronia nyctiphanis]RXJ71834.1 hypothetical protein CS022_19390 [Veronia nyctiphanis]RXJ72585.1 hypothetical protein CS022_14845 [Veronia nyctiphanis]